MKHGVRIACLVFSTVLVISVILIISEAAARAQQPQSGNPLDLFAKVFPVFSHPRCINCHGVVQSNPGIIRSVTGKACGG